MQNGPGQAAQASGSYSYKHPIYPYINGPGGALRAQEFVTTVEPPWSSGDTRNKNQGCPGNDSAIATKARPEMAGNPCNIASGNKYQKEVDRPGTLGRLPIIRHYNSLGDDRDVGFGHGWTASFLTRMEPLGDDWRVRRADGKGYRFTSNGVSWQTDPDVQTSLLDDGSGYLVVTPDGTEQGFSADGRLLSEIDRNGRTLSYIYDLSDRLIEIAGPLGDTLSISYYGGGHIATITDDAGRQWGYRYDSDDNLQFVDNPDGSTRQYLYENGLSQDGERFFPHRLTGIIDERGIRYATFAYDNSGRIISNYHAGDANRIDITNITGTSRNLKNSQGQNTSYTIQTLNNVNLVKSIAGKGCSTCAEATATYTYDPANNNVLTEKIHNLLTEYGDYNSDGNPGYVIHRKGTAGARRVDYTYDPRFRDRVSTMSEPSVSAGNSKVTTYEYDDAGNVTSIRIDGFTPAGVAVSQTTAFQYNGPLNQLSLIDGPRTDVADITALDYYADDASEGDNRGRLRSVIGPTGIADRDNIQYSATGKVLSEQRPNGLSVTYTYYPGNDRLETITETDQGSSDDRVTHFTYLPTGETDVVTTAHGTSDATSIDFDYDDARRLTRITDGLGNYIEYELDTEGNVTQEDIYDSTHVLRNALSRTFDAYSHVDLVTRENESLDYYVAADGRPITVKNGRGKTTSLSYDNAKRQTTQVADSSGVAANTGFNDYDAADRPGYIRDPEFNQTYFDYDDLGDLLSQDSPDTGLTSFDAYDGAGNILQKTDAKGLVFQYSYDALNRLVVVDVQGSTDDDLSFVYDSCTNGTGRLCSVAKGIGGSNPVSVSYAYNAFGDVTTHQGLSYGYDAAGRIASVTYPSGALVEYDHDAAGQTTEVTLTIDGQTQVMAQNVLYEPFGPLKSLQYGNGLTLSQIVDTAYRILDITVPGVMELTDGTYDEAGNLIARTEDTGTPELAQFTYDGINRLDTADGAFGSRDYDLDRNGNRNKLVSDGVTTTYTYPRNRYRKHENQPTKDTVWNYTHDANGSITAKTSIGAGPDRLFAYSAHNRLLQVSEDDGTVTIQGEYAYNGLGQRVRKDAGGESFEYRYGLGGKLLAILDDTGQPVRELVYLNRQPLAVVDHEADAVYYVHNDHLGTPRALSDESGTRVWTAVYDPFGAATVDEDPDQDGISVTLNLRFPGQYYDQETGLHYNYFRTYDPSTGRYLESDPIGLWGGTNTYEYVYSNPLIYIDPYGLWALGDPLPQGFVDFSAGLGDALLLGQGQRLRDLTGVDGGVDKCSNAYDYGSYAALAAGGGRLAYAGLAKGGSLLASSGAQASGFRQGLKTFFRGGFGRNWRPPNLRGKTDAQLRASAGKTNFGINAYGAGVTAAAAAGAAECGCEQ